MLHIPKGKISRSGLSTLSYDGAKLWNMFSNAFLHKEIELKKSKLKNLFKINFLNPMLDTLFVVFVVYSSTAAKSIRLKLNIDRILI